MSHWRLYVDRMGWDCDGMEMSGQDHAKSTFGILCATERTQLCTGIYFAIETLAFGKKGCFWMGDGGRESISSDLANAPFWSINPETLPFLTKTILILYSRWTLWSWYALVSKLQRPKNSNSRVAFATQVFALVIKIIIKKNCLAISKNIKTSYN